MASGSYDMSIKLWNWRDGRILHELNGHTKGVYALYFTAGRLISASQDQHIVVWDYTNGIDPRLFE